MIEVWKDVKGYEGYYQVSTHGRVKSVRYDRILKQSYNNTGIATVGFSVKNKHETKAVNVLIAKTFANNQRLNEIYKFAKDNVEKPKNLIRFNMARTSFNEKPIKAIYPDDTVKIYDSATAYAKEHNIRPSTIVNVLKGHIKSHKGVKFEYLEVE